MTEKRTFSIWVILCFVCSSAILTGCDTSLDSRMADRLDRFTNLLPSELRQDFDNGRFEETAAGIDSLAAADPEFAEAWDELKKSEGIGLFTAAEAVDYYVDYFLQYGSHK